jgi:hypothetical protein
LGSAPIGRTLHRLVRTDLMLLRLLLGLLLVERHLLLIFHDVHLVLLAALHRVEV